MAVPWTSPELAARYSSRVEELRKFFALRRLHYGTLEDIATLAARLDASGSFRDDLSSMVRIILVRDGGCVPRADLLEIVIIAIAGADIADDDIDKAPQEVQQTVIHPPVQQIFAFLNGVLSRPWNESLGKVRLQPEPILDDGDALKSSPEVPGIHMSPESELLEEEDVSRNPLVAGMQVIAPQNPAATTSDPASVSESSTLPEPNFAREPDAPSEPEAIIADEASLQPEPLAVYASTVQMYSSKVAPWPKPIVEPANDPLAENIFFPPPVRAVAVESRSHPASPPPSTLDPEPPSPSAFHLPHPKLGSLQAPPAGRIRADHIRIALLYGIAASVFVAALMYTANRHSYSVIRAANQPVVTPAVKAMATSAQDSPSVTAAATTIATLPEVPSISTPGPAPDSATAAPHVTRRNWNNYVAPPFSTPIPPELAVHRSTPSPSASATLASSQSNKADKLIEIASSSAIQSRLLNVPSSKMAGNLLSAPAPRYPMLAKVVHLQGQVIVEAVVDRNGNVSLARVLSGHRLLRGATVEEVLSRRYRPYLVHGHPVEVSTTITLDFPPSWTPSLSRQTATYVNLQAR